MGPKLKKSFSWEIDNFSNKNDGIFSKPFSSGGCEWYLSVAPKGYFGYDKLSPVLNVEKFDSLSYGWKRRASFSFVFLNQSGKELYNSSHKEAPCALFCAENPRSGFANTLPLSKLHKKGFLENDKLIIEVYIDVHEVVHQGKSTENDTYEHNGVQILASQSAMLGEIIAQHPHYASDFRAKNKEEAAAYYSIFLCLMERLSKSPQNLSVAELNNAQNELTMLTKAGFKLDWVKPKLKELSLERKKAVSDGSQVQPMEERVKDLELTLSNLKTELKKEKLKSAKVSSFVFIDLVIRRFFRSWFSI